MRKNSVFVLVSAALFAALVCAATLLVRVPIPATGGYANLGDGVLLTAAFLLPLPSCALAGGIGSMLADLLAGYAAYAPATLLIKGAAALTAALIWKRLEGRRGAMIAACVLGEAVMVLGYLFYEGVLLGLGAAAVAGVPGNLAQAAVGTAVACVLTRALLRVPEVQRLRDRLRR